MHSISSFINQGGSYQDYSLVSFIQIQLYDSFLLNESLLMRPSDKPNTSLYRKLRKKQVSLTSNRFIKVR